MFKRPVSGCAIFTLMVLFAGSAFAQDRHGPNTPNHWYDPDCCRWNDCDIIAAPMVKETPAGYVVTIRPGTHPMWPIEKARALVLTYPYLDKRVRRSKDESWHVCINGNGAPLCLYVKGGGF